MRGFRIFTFGLVLAGLAFVGTWLGLGWAYAHSLTHPPCSEPVRLAEGPAPQETWLATADGRRVRAWYYPSQNGAAVLALGGLDGALGQHLPPIGFLLQAGYGALQLDTRACARPLGPVSLGAHEIQEGAAGLDFLAARPEVDPNRLVVFGFSMGAATAIRLAARDRRAAGVIAEGGFFNLGDDLVEPGSRAPLPRRLLLHGAAWGYWLETGQNPWQVNPLADLPALSPRPLLLIYGQGEVDSGHGRQQYAAAGEPKELWLVPGGEHGTNHLAAPQEYRRRVLEFLEKIRQEAYNSGNSSPPDAHPAGRNCAWKNISRKATISTC